ncbi:MAG: 50S ribosomal protein L24 [Planctomycetota bacterium]|nr:MAG: 50S ribosomal protein L24 [Planctomycetota bacterium]
MAAKLHVKKGDEVVVIAGNERGRRGRVLHTYPREGRVVVEGVNLRLKRLPKTTANPQGGTVEREVPIPASNVLLWSEKAGKGVRTRIEIQDDRKIRVGIPCGTKFD